jgi:hypothetical protein
LNSQLSEFNQDRESRNFSYIAINWRSRNLWKHVLRETKLNVYSKTAFRLSQNATKFPIPVYVHAAYRQDRRTIDTEKSDATSFFSVRTSCRTQNWEDSQIRSDTAPESRGRRPAQRTFSLSKAGGWRVASSALFDGSTGQCSDAIRWWTGIRRPKAAQRTLSSSRADRERIFSSEPLKGTSQTVVVL